MTVTCESGTFRQAGPFSAHSTASRIALDLLPATSHHLEASGKVQITGGYDGCYYYYYGGHMLRLSGDRYGNLRLIEQRPLVPALWLPLVLKAHPWPAQVRAGGRELPTRPAGHRQPASDQGARQTRARNWYLPANLV